MAMAEALPPDASTASTGLRLNYIADRVFALSGKVPCNGDGAVLIEAETGSGFIQASFETFNWGDVSTNEDMSFLFTLNDIDIAYIRVGSAIELYRSNPIDILLPPFSKIKVFGKNEAGTSANNLSVVISGRVYEA